MNRNLALLLLLTTLIMPIISTYTWLYYQKKAIKKEIKHTICKNIDKSNLVLIKLTQKQQDYQLKWQHSKEFEYKNEMYDIVSKKTIGDTTYFWCWWDSKETALNKQLAKLTNFIFGNNNKQKEKKETLKNFYKSIYFQELFNYKTHLLNLKATLQKPFICNIYLQYINQPDKPPRIVF